MDLQTIGKNINKRTKYKTLKDFAHDVRLTFHNAMLYNQTGSDIWQMAERLLKFFEDKYAELKVKEGLDENYDPPPPKDEKLYKVTPPPPPGFVPPGVPLPTVPSVPQHKSPPTDCKNTVASAQPKSTKRKHDQISALASTPPVGLIQQPPPPPPPKANGAANHARNESYILTLEEKKQLGLQLNTLKADEVAQVVQIMKLRPNEKGEVEINLDKMDNPVLVELSRYLNTIANNTDPNMPPDPEARLEIPPVQNDVNVNTDPTQLVGGTQYVSYANAEEDDYDNDPDYYLDNKDNHKRKKRKASGKTIRGSRPGKKRSGVVPPLEMTTYDTGTLDSSIYRHKTQ